MKAKFFSMLFVITLSLFAKPNVAVLQLTGTAGDSLQLLALTSKLESQLFETDSVTVLERSQMAAILHEMEFQQSGCTDAACAVEIGQLLNVQQMIVGSVDKIGKVHTVTARIIDVGSGKLVKSVSEDYIEYSIEELQISAMKRIALMLAGISKADIDFIAPVKKIVFQGDKQENKEFKEHNYKDFKGNTNGTASLVFSFPNSPVAQLRFHYIDYERGTKGVKINNIPEGKYPYTIIEGNTVTTGEVLAMNYKTEVITPKTIFTSETPSEKRWLEAAISKQYVTQKYKGDDIAFGNVRSILKFEIQPVNAQLYLNDTLYDQGMLGRIAILNVPTNRSHKIRIEAAGFRSAKSSLSTGIGPLQDFSIRLKPLITDDKDSENK